MTQGWRLGLLPWLLLGCGARTGLVVRDAEPPPPQCATDDECDNHVFCDGQESCREEQCIAGAPLICLGSTTCSLVACDETARMCRTTPATDDRDGDGFRAPRAGTLPGAPDRCGDDCDDNDTLVHPGAVERCNGVDDDCNGIIDDNATLTPTGDAVRVSEAAVAPSGPGGVQWTGSRYGVSYWGYDGGRAHVYFRQIDQTGVPSSTQQTLTTTPNDAFGASLAWSGRVLGAVWQDRRDPSGGYEIYFNRLTPEGERLGPDQRISFAPGFSVNPAIVWTGEEFVLVWQDERDTVGEGGYEIYAQRVDAEGRLILPNQRLTRDMANSEAPAVAVNDTGLAVTWTDGRGGGRGVWFATFTRGLTRATADRQVSPAGQSAVGAQVVWNRDRWVLAWFDDAESSPDHEVWAATRDAAGSAMAPPRRLTTDPGFSRYPSLLPLGDRVLVAWADDRDGAQYSLWARVFDANLVPLSAESRVTRTAMGPTASVYPSLVRGPEGDVGVLFRDQREGRIQAWFTRLRCAIPR
ncbi:MAG: hypothetical protein JWM10_3795 [Myxococcaceae bacterium]|nr:hypothetical protein [Myxococcaceae bacterium]